MQKRETRGEFIAIHHREHLRGKKVPEKVYSAAKEEHSSIILIDPDWIYAAAAQVDKDHC